MPNGWLERTEGIAMLSGMVSEDKCERPELSFGFKEVKVSRKKQGEEAASL